jgi:hypothetical protein
MPTQYLDPATAGTMGGTQSSQATYFPQQGLIPGYAQGFATGAFPQAQQAGGQYQGYITDPTASPLYKNTLSGLLASLQPSEAQATTNLQDMFRQAGNLASGAYGSAAANLQGNILRNRQALASQLLGQQFPQMTQALMAPQQLATQLLQALKLSQGFGAPQLAGGGAGGAGGAGGSPSMLTGALGQYGVGQYDSGSPFTMIGAGGGGGGGQPGAGSPFGGFEAPYETAWTGAGGGVSQYGTPTSPGSPADYYDYTPFAGAGLSGGPAPSTLSYGPYTSITEDPGAFGSYFGMDQGE